MEPIIELPKAETVTAPLASRMHEMIAYTQSLEVYDAETAQQAVDAAKAYRGYIASVEEKRKELKAPILEAGRNIDAMFKPLTSRVDAERKELDKKILKWRKAEDERLKREAREAQFKRLQEAKAQAEALKKEGLEENATEVIEKALVTRPHEKRERGKTRGQMGGVASTRKMWAFELEDIESVPSEFLALDEKKVREAIKNGARKIPGVKIYQKETIAVR